MSAVFRGPFGFWFFPILNALFPGIPPLIPTPPTPTPQPPPIVTTTRPIMQSFKLEIPWNWMTNDTGPVNVPFNYNPSQTTIYDVLLKGDAVCAPDSNWLDIYFNEQKVAPLHWGGGEENAKKTFNQSVKPYVVNGSNTVHATGGKDYYFTSTVTFSINAALVITYSGPAPTSIMTEASIVV